MQNMMDTFVENMELINKYENEVLELIENQVSTDGRDLTQSDLQGRITVIVTKLMKEACIEKPLCLLCKKLTSLVPGGNVCRECSNSIPF